MIDSWNAQVVARTLWAECRNEPIDGQYAVAHVIRNRAVDSRWPATAAGVCLQPQQFSCWNSSDKQRTRMISLTSDELTKQFSIAFAVLHGDNPDNTGGANHYHADYVNPSWADESKKTITIGRHIFYRL